MKNLIIIIVLIISNNVHSQKEGQLFCEGDPTQGYMPLLKSKKHIIWSNTFYTEANLGEEILNGKKYNKYSQTWETGEIEHLFLREENQIILQYEEEEKAETVRLPKSIKVGKTWKTQDGQLTYKILSIKAKLKTPVCEYTNLLALKSSFKNGSFTFYYQKGYGYIGATQNGEIISFVVPYILEELLNRSKK